MKRQAQFSEVILLGLLALFLTAIVVTVRPVTPLSLAEAFDWRPSGPVGPIGGIAGRLTTWLVGPILYLLLPLFPLAILRRLWRGERGKAGPIQAAGMVVGVTGLLAHPAWQRVGGTEAMGGVLGAGIEGLLASLVGPLGSFLVLACLSAYLPLRLLPPIHFDLPAIDPYLQRFGARMRRLRAQLPEIRWEVPNSLRALWWRVESLWTEEEERDAPRADEATPTEPPASRDTSTSTPRRMEFEPEQAAAPAAEAKPSREAPLEDGLFARAQEGAQNSGFALSRDPSELLNDPTGESPARRRRRRGELPLPSVDLLEDVPKEDRGFSADALQMKAQLLLETLSHYGIDGRINEIRPGPVVTTFEFEPAPGVKVSSITSRQDDLALAMKAIRIRIEAPIPGKAAVGIEIPNPFPQMVTLKEVIGAIDAKTDSPVAIALGKDTEGEPHVADIREMPHLLVAGATGSGKSVCINAIICNLLLRNGPDQLRLLMIDPKMLELSVYNGIPHLMHPVITEPREALKAVKWAVAEMSVRYHKLAKHGVRNIKDYNDRVKEGRVQDDEGNKVKETMPYFVLIIDELADLMMQLGQDLETPIARLAQMARAVGIHLVLATQRPSVNVITGVIKANFPSRIAFRVMSKVDSRTILDTMGAEQLLGKGDMLFLLAGSPQPVRVHGAYLAIEECERIVAHWQQYTEEDAELDLDSGSTSGGIDLGEDELLDEAKKLVVLSQSGSTSMLQRRLRVGYTRAARLMDMLEASGVVGPFEGSKAREVLISREELEAEA